MRIIILSHVAGLASSYFYTFYHKRHDFRKNITEYKVFLSIFSKGLSKTFLTIRRIKRDVIRNVFWSSCKVHVILV